MILKKMKALPIRNFQEQLVQVHSIKGGDDQNCFWRSIAAQHPKYYYNQDNYIRVKQDVLDYFNAQISLPNQGVFKSLTQDQIKGALEKLESENEGPSMLVVGKIIPNALQCRISMFCRDIMAQKENSTDFCYLMGKSTQSKTPLFNIGILISNSHATGLILKTSPENERIINANSTYPWNPNGLGENEHDILLQSYLGTIESVQYILDKGVDINTLDNNGATPLVWGK